MNSPINHFRHLTKRIAVGALVLLLTALSVVGQSEAQTKPESMRHAVAIDGDYAVVGAQWADGFAGAAYVLRRDGDKWVEVQALRPGDLGPHDHFGSSVAINGDYIVVGAPWQDMLRGVTYIYKRDGDGWSEHGKLTAGDARPDDRFGQDLVFESGALTIVTSRSNTTGAARFIASMTWRSSSAHTGGSASGSVKY